MDDKGLTSPWSCIFKNHEILVLLFTLSMI